MFDLMAGHILVHFYEKKVILEIVNFSLCGHANVDAQEVCR